MSLMSTAINVNVNSCLIIDLCHSMSFMSNASHVGVNSRLLIDLFHSNVLHVPHVQRANRRGL